jgi:uncharacterized protein YdaU (DUF1376 family)
VAWIRVESSVARNKKFVKAGPAASWLWVCGLAYCQEGLTDGFIPTEALEYLGVKHPRKMAVQLVLACLWDAVEGGWQVHDYLDENRSAAEVQAIKAERRAAGAEGGRVSGIARRAKRDAEANLKQPSKQNGSKPEATVEAKVAANTLKQTKHSSKPSTATSTATSTAGTDSSEPSNGSKQNSAICFAAECDTAETEQRSESDDPQVDLTPPVMEFPVVGDPRRQIWELHQSRIDRLVEAYPNLDVLAQCRKARVWAEENPGKRKTARGMPAFLFKWMDSATNRGGGRAQTASGPNGSLRTAGNEAALQAFANRK